MDLSGYAAARFLRFTGSRAPVNFSHVTAGRTLNAMEGVLPGGAFGMLAHRVGEDGAPATLAAVRVPEAALLPARTSPGARLIGGTLALERAGHLTDAAGLDALCERAAAAARRLRARCAPALVPAAFAEPLPAPAGPPGPWQAWLGMTPEDPAAYHRAFGGGAVPGRPLAVARGDGVRLALHDTGRAGHVHAAVLLPARPGLPDTLPGGVADGEHWYAVTARVAAVWRMTEVPPPDPTELLDQAAGCARRAGLLALEESAGAAHLRA